jgi:hypothetical protein
LAFHRKFVSELLDIIRAVVEIAAMSDAHLIGTQKVTGSIRTARVAPGNAVSSAAVKIIASERQARLDQWPLTL